MTTALRTADVVAALRARHPAPAYAFLEQVRSRTGYKGEIRTADAFAMSLWPSRGVRLHRSDWIRERDNPAKAEEIARFADYWWVVINDEKIVHDGEIPATWGLMLVSPAKKGVPTIKVKRAATKLDPQPLSREMLASIFRNVHGAVDRDFVPRASVQGEIDAAREAGARGALAARAHAVEDAKRQLNDLRLQVAAFEKASGVFMGQAWSFGNIGEAVRLVRRIGIDGVVARAATLAESLEAHAQSLRQAVEASRASLPPQDQRQEAQHEVATPEAQEQEGTAA